MKTLYLLRHAHTIDAAPPLMGDYERILSPRGTEEAAAIGSFMQKHEMYPDFVLSSSSVRTIQTARLIFGTLFSKVGTTVASHFDRALYQAPANAILSEIHTMDPSIQQLLVVGHNPGIAELAVALRPHPQFINYAPGTLGIFKTDCESWADVVPSTVTLDQVFVPKV